LEWDSTRESIPIKSVDILWQLRVGSNNAEGSIHNCFVFSFFFLYDLIWPCVSRNKLCIAYSSFYLFSSIRLEHWITASSLFWQYVWSL
jgi:hypothetical protein